MQTIFESGLIWWITAIEIPLFSSLFYMVTRNRSLNDQENVRLREIIEIRSSQLKESMAAFKLESARHCAKVSEVRELEKRLINHLTRIEEKLDATTLKAQLLEVTKTDKNGGYK